MGVKLSELELRMISLLDNALTMGELTKRAGVTKGYISRTVNSLRDKGFVEISTKGITKK
jgi:DNA-binding MarR family transcriptional regulator